ncbi:IQ motif-containing protein [Lauvirus lau218]|uniref:IQ motif-containing protein n=1 Tax=Lauvirus lau218 TaxID=1465639 RepID=A0A060BR32_9CAUD|nr:IQ motif-containing protein [Lauvirus lau218]
MATQSKSQSLTEIILNVVSGWVVSYLLWIWLIIPIWDIKVSVQDNIIITTIFTISAVIRGYLWRRFFNKKEGNEK